MLFLIATHLLVKIAYPSPITNDLTLLFQSISFRKIVNSWHTSLITKDKDEEMGMGQRC